MRILPGEALLAKPPTSKKGSKVCPIFTVKELAAVFHCPKVSRKSLKILSLPQITFFRRKNWYEGPRQIHLHF